MDDWMLMEEGDNYISVLISVLPTSKLKFESIRYRCHDGNLLMHHSSTVLGPDTVLLAFRNEVYLPDFL